MDKPERDLFKTTRDGLGLTQTAVAGLGGVKQSTISKIEIEPNYSPSVEAFRKALKGIGFTIVSFYAQIEGRNSPRPELADHDSLPALASEEGIAAAAIHRLTQRISTLERRLRTHTRVRQKNHRHAATTRAEAAEVSPPRRSRRPRNADGKKRTRGET